MIHYIFGAKATAAGLYRALRVCKPNQRIHGFLVTNMIGNPQEIWGCPVCLVADVSKELTDIEKKQTKIYVAVPELIHSEIEILLKREGFYNLEMINSQKEAHIMERYYELSECGFKSLHSLEGTDVDTKSKLMIYEARFYKDKVLNTPPQTLAHIRSLYLGCCQAQKDGVAIHGKADFYDNTGDNISAKNPNRCEMTAYYWIWKNRLHIEDEYIGVFHYRRRLDISESDLCRMEKYHVDVVLPFPMIHYPSAGIHHTWYVKDADWELMLSVLSEMYPDYYAKCTEIFSQPYFYNYNMFVARKEVFAQFCKWIFPILDQIEERSFPKGVDRKDRYTAYLSESLTTLYFMYHRNDLKIYHTGRLLYT